MENIYRLLQPGLKVGPGRTGLETQHSAICLVYSFSAYVT